MKNNMILFWGGIYSNFYPVQFTLEDRVWENSEQYFMWKKALTFGDLEIAEKITKVDDPYHAKKLGRKVKDFDDKKWFVVCRDIMFDACYAKFSQNEVLKEQMMASGDKLIVEASPYDKIWGIGMGAENPLALNPAAWKGKNWLGEVLMKVRDTFIQEAENE